MDALGIAMQDYSVILDVEKVLDRFGKWPDFHDAEVRSVLMERSGGPAPWIEFVVFTWLTTDHVTPSGHYEQVTHSLIRFRCEYVGDNEIGGFNQQNVLNSLSFARTADDDGLGTEVCLSPIYGLGGRLRCHHVRVIDVLPASADGDALSRAP